MSEVKPMTVPPRGPLTIRNRDTGLVVVLPPIADGVSRDDARQAGDFARRAGFTDLPARKLEKLLVRMPGAELALFAELLALHSASPSGDQVGTRRRVLEACGHMSKLDSAAYRPMILNELYTRQTFREGEPEGEIAIGYDLQDRNGAWVADPPT
jgi:hypothetical protein